MITKPPIWNIVRQELREAARSTKIINLIIERVKETPQDEADNEPTKKDR